MFMMLNGKLINTSQIVTISIRNDNRSQYIHNHSGYEYNEQYCIIAECSNKGDYIISESFDSYDKADEELNKINTMLLKNQNKEIIIE